MKHKHLFFFLTFCALSACTKRMPVKDFQMDSTFARYYRTTLEGSKIDTASFNLCGLIKSDWDSVLIVRPYARPETVKSLNIGNYSEVSDMVYHQSFNEESCTLLFIHKGEYVGHSVVTRRFIDLSTLVSEKNKQVSWINKRTCNRINVIKYIDRYRLFFI